MTAGGSAREAAMITYLEAAGDIQTRVLDVGKGPAVVFVHGLGARADRWRRNLPAVAAAGYRGLAIDLPGHGFATKSGAFDFGVPACAAWLAALLERLDVREYALVGTSLGGFIAGHVACNHPERVKALMLVGTLGITPMGETARDAISARFGTVSREGIARKLNTVLFDKSLVTPEWIEEEWRINNSLGAQAAFARIADYIKHRIDDDVIGERLAAQMAQGLPVAMVWGVEDLAVPLSVGHLARGVLPAARYWEMPRTGHGPYLEDPATFNAHLLGFLGREAAYQAAAGAGRQP